MIRKSTGMLLISGGSEIIEPDDDARQHAEG